jgi:Rho GDP-dissociation inhibitor
MQTSCFAVSFNECFVLVGEIDQLKSKSFVIQEGCHYQLKIYFYVQREIVTGLKYVQSSYRAGVRGL